jgi:hypothetical protein
MGDTARLLISLASSAVIVYLAPIAIVRTSPEIYLSPLNWLLVRQMRALNERNKHHTAG